MGLIIHPPWSAKYRKYTLCGLAVVLTLPLLYFQINISSKTNLLLRYSPPPHLPEPVTNSQSLQQLPVNDPQLHTSISPEHTLEAKSISTLKTICRGEANLTRCDDCLRPAVRHFTSIVTEIGFEDHLIRDTPAGFFTAPPVVVQELVKDYLIEPRLDCPYLLVVQPSILERRYERDTVRNTWGSVARNQTWPNRKVNAKVKVIFVVASQVTLDTNKDLYTRQLQEMRSEASQHGDILYVNILDSYTSLTLKLMSAFKWVKDKCPCVKFVLKVDYDTFVNVPLLVDTLLYFENRFEFSILGFAYTTRSLVDRDGKWSLPKDKYPMVSFPVYASGCGYVVSNLALSQIVDQAPHFYLLPVEDAFITGVMRRVTGCKLFSLINLFTHLLDTNWDLCLMVRDGKILGTSVDKDKHQKIWESFDKNSCP